MDCCETDLMSQRVDPENLRELRLVCVVGQKCRLRLRLSLHLRLHLHLPLFAGVGRTLDGKVDMYCY